ncbi:MAG: hypothetical protein JXR22_01485 [Prolixibacteraceae bacterium]|nr:hypothetical protein [Prolixibacteraceae bacterium]
MKKIISAFILTMLFATSCQKDQETARPDWLNAKIDELISDDQCSISTVTVYDFEGEEYYNIYCGVWSCMFCQLYDAEGKAVNWDSEAFQKFHETSKVIDEFPACEE